MGKYMNFIMSKCLDIQLRMQSKGYSRPAQVPCADPVCKCVIKFICANVREERPAHRYVLVSLHPTDPGKSR